MSLQIRTSTNVHGLRFIEGAPFRDERGSFVRTFDAEEYRFEDEAGRPLVFLEDDMSTSRRNVVRGLHGDANTWKLIHCAHGHLFMAVADMRSGSATHLHVDCFELRGGDGLQALIPAGCATGTACLSEIGVLAYKQTTRYGGAARQFTVRWDDPKLGIRWPVHEPIMSARDAGASMLDSLLP
jgi:dTDP-4-dehydrorhamnose 3,5-epimerase